MLIINLNMFLHIFLFETAPDIFFFGLQRSESDVTIIRTCLTFFSYFEIKKEVTATIKRYRIFRCKKYW